MVTVVVGVFDQLAFAAGQLVPDDDLATVQVGNVQLVTAFLYAYTALLPCHRHRVLVGLPGDQTGLVHLAGGMGLSCDTGRRQVRFELGELIANKTLAGRLTGGSMSAYIGYSFQPVQHMLAQMLLITKRLAIEAVPFDILDAGLDLAFALWVVALTGVDTKSSRSCILVEPLVKLQFAVLLLDHHQLGLVVYAFFGQAAKIAQSLVMQLNELLGIQWPQRQTHVHQARIRQYKNDKVNDRFYPANHHVTQLTRINLALHTWHLVHHRLVIAQLTGGHLFLQGADITPDAAVRRGQLAQLLGELAGNLDGAKARKTGQQVNQVAPIGIQLLTACRIVLLLGNACFIQAHVFTHAVTGNPQLFADGANRKSIAAIV